MGCSLEELSGDLSGRAELVTAARAQGSLKPARVEHLAKLALGFDDLTRV